MILLVVGGLVLLMCLAVVLAAGMEPGVPPEEVAVAYETAWDRLDFDTLWSLSGDALHDGRDRGEFIAAKRRAYATRAELGGLLDRVTVDEVTTGSKASVVGTRVHLLDGSVVRNVVRLRRRRARWEVVGYSLGPAAAP